MRKRFTAEEVKKSKGVIITYPTMGEFHMKVSDVVKASDGKEYVEGLVWQESGYYQYNMPEDFHGENEYMNFPLSCVKSLSDF